ncbi:hypothetical protein AMATHDRAFT_51658 [Amanita thiersii Skay4041]|uniref:BTB domain-containing protein n=1 Tax=Amanita thiersii Skay4041 TaxID=703135 RepID=A0A2A9NCF0_9AGAR|nr:hypothetical protein AMATHDRAFT_51658 [Amanita thiersii Skay4041]
MDTLGSPPISSFLSEEFCFESSMQYNGPLLPHDQVSYNPCNEQNGSMTQYTTLDTETPYLQVPTPLSTNPSPLIREHETGDTIVSVSTAFHPGSHSVESDTVFTSSDAVLFYVHSQIIMGASDKAFSSILSAPLSNERYRNTIINIPETSSVLNVIIHMLYNTPCAQYSPTFEILSAAVNAMPHYDIDPKQHITPGSPLYNLLLSHAPLHPIDVYAIAAYFDLHELAVSTSSHLLAFPLYTISDELAKRIGPLYLKRLMCLHLGRNNALKQILLSPPPPHPPTRECNFENQKRLTPWESRPDLSTHGLQIALDPLTEHLTCELCHQTLRQRIKDVVVQWASLRRTIE